MANFSKYFHETVKTKSCGDFFHPGKTCTQAKLDIIPGLLAGAVKYFLPILLLPSLTKFEWTRDFFVKQLILSAKAVFGGFVPAIVAISAFCGFYEHLRKHYLRFYGLPVSFGVLLAAVILPKSAVNVLACGGVNHLIEFILEASKGTVLYELKSNLMVGTLVFMTLSSTIVYLFRTCQYRPFWLLHVPHTSNFERRPNDDDDQKPSGWMDRIIQGKKKICSHQEASCEGFLWEEMKKVTKIGIVLSTAKSIISGFAELRDFRRPLLQMPRVFLKNIDACSLLFLPAYCGSFKLINCLLNRLFQRDSTKNTIMAGFLSGSCYMFYPNFTLVSFALIRSVQLLWMKHILEYKGEKYRKLISKIKALPMGSMVLWASVSILFLGRFMYPHLSSKYIVMCMNYITGSLSDAVIANYYGILMGLQ